MVTYPLHDVAAFTITRDKPLSCANLLAKQVVFPRLYPPQIFHLLFCLPGDIFPSIRPYFSKELRPFIDLQAFILTHTSLNACAHLSCVTFEGRKPYERQRDYSAWYGPVLWAKLPSRVRTLHSLEGFKRAVRGLDLEMLMDDSGCVCMACNAWFLVMSSSWYVSVDHYRICIYFIFKLIYTWISGYLLFYITYYLCPYLVVLLLLFYNWHMNKVVIIIIII